MLFRQVFDRRFIATCNDGLQTAFDRESRYQFAGVPVGPVN
jgi:hypothetical protein